MYLLNYLLQQYRSQNVKSVFLTNICFVAVECFATGIGGGFPAPYAGIFFSPIKRRYT